MSSPFTAPNNGYPGRGAASSPGPSGRVGEVSHSPEDVTIRPMRRTCMTFPKPRPTNPVSLVLLSEGTLHIR